ncbi:MAG: hypothetical protein CENE_03237 [Candidatus Celerinatantimonas neptuna]|nr:MAG: hypothetical protein CENE_03237 [Candidatus Celerinatantimonas neptuna]
MSIFDQLVEQQISQAIKNGELDDLPGKGKPLQLDDDSQVPEELKAGYRILKNAGYLPPEIQQRQEALHLCNLLQSLDTQAINNQTFKQHHIFRKLQELELKMRLKGMDTTFIHHYIQKLDIL